MSHDRFQPPLAQLLDLEYRTWELQKYTRITIKQFDKAVKVFKFCTLMYYAY